MTKKQTRQTLHRLIWDLTTPFILVAFVLCVLSQRLFTAKPNHQIWDAFTRSWRAWLQVRTADPETLLE